VLVSDDMLSLAIGKNGHNVRLAAKLTGWHIDIRSESQKKQESEQKIAVAEDTLTHLNGIGPKTAEVLIKAGMSSIQKLASISTEDLTTVQGIGVKTAEKIIESAKTYLLEHAQNAEAKGNNNGRKRKQLRKRPLLKSPPKQRKPTLRIL